MDRFSAIAAFIAVAENGGFSPAARRLGLVTSSVTRQVDGLEEHLGVLLFNRSTRQVTLTDAGARYLEDARRILSELEEADRAINEVDGPPSGLLRVSLPVAFGRLHVAPAVPSFLQNCPDIELELMATDSIVNLVEDRIDLAIRLSPLESSSLIARKLAPHRRVLCASPDYLNRHGMPQCPEDLGDHNCLSFDYEAAGATWHLSADGRVQKIKVQGSLRASGSEFLVEGALGGLGLVLLPTWLVGGDLKAGRLKRVLPNWEADVTADQGVISFVYMANRRGAKKLTAFMDHMARWIGASPYWER